MLLDKVLPDVLRNLYAVGGVTRKHSRLIEVPKTYCGDLNCAGTDSTTVRADLTSMLDAHGLQQFVETATRRTPSVDNLLDLVIGNAESERIQHVAVRATHDVSDHDLVTWSLSFDERLPCPVRSYRFRNLKKINLEQFKSDVRGSELFSAPALTADEFADQLNETVTNILNAHCPLQMRRTFASKRRENRWLSPEAVSGKRNRRRLERKWRSSRNEVDYVAYWSSSSRGRCT